MRSLTKTTIISSLAILAAFMLPVLVVAQTAPVADPAVDPGALLNQLIAAVHAKHWGVAIGFGLTFVTFVLRTVVGPRWKWIQTDRGGAVFTILVATAGTIGLELASGVSSWMVVLDAVSAAMSSAGGYSLVKKLLQPSDKPATPPVEAPKGNTP